MAAELSKTDPSRAYDVLEGQFKQAGENTSLADAFINHLVAIAQGVCTKMRWLTKVHKEGPLAVTFEINTEDHEDCWHITLDGFKNTQYTIYNELGTEHEVKAPLTATSDEISNLMVRYLKQIGAGW